MKIACDKCMEVIDANNIKVKDWLRVRTDYTEYRLCPICSDGFWRAVDSELPAIIKQEDKGK